MPNPQNPFDPMYLFIDTQPADVYPCQRDSSLSHFTVRQFTPENISNSLPATVTKSTHGLSNGQTIRALQFIDSPLTLATGMEQLNNRTFYIQQATTNTFILTDSNSVPIDSTEFTPYISGGQFTVTGPTLPVVNPSHFPPPGIPPVSPVA